MVYYNLNKVLVFPIKFKGSLSRKQQKQNFVEF